MRWLLALIGLMPGAAVAHPHMFIQTAVAVIFDEAGLATGIRVTWTYDDYTSLQVMADVGITEDASGQLSAEQLAALNGFDMDWDPDWDGDSHARLDDRALSLSGPQDWTASYADGALSSTHRRDFSQPLDLRDHVLGVASYDPWYYVFYELSPAIELVNPPPEAGCRAIYRPADTAKAKLDLEAQLRTMQDKAEVEFPAVGKNFAAEAWIICASGT
ncbi:DUF1007 family protein [Stagnihabitans tardus]|uniref:DUF1007 family protein n=1 Tax=Stagnihabitans tardus TaxID=2699202 RepID=A0AAE4YD00_9RHOB|nr:DUF1007 family protein [Stagnihabitans tardus]NBZ89171.1 DUF1007 family protein [Stagnihabitans tardus]